jgi:proteasome accessory factor A
MKMGLETEYGVVGGWTAERCRDLLRAACCRPHVPATKEGVFLANGGRFYVDNGSHPEFSTPEAESPRDTVTHVLAGHQIVGSFAGALGFAVFHGNVDYVSGHSWGTHENYEISAALDAGGIAAFLPHLATRVIYSGAGGIDPKCPAARFVLSPRACLIGVDVSQQGTVCRAMVFHKPDQYGAGYRLHVMCGESNCSHLASFLKIGTTALVAALIDARIPVGPGPLHASASQVLREVSSDLEMRRCLLLADKRQMTALDIQATYLEECRRHLGRLPEWAPRVLELWEDVLVGLEAADKEIWASLDWGIQRTVWQTLVADASRDEQLAPAPEDTNPPAISDLRARCAEAYLRYHQIGPESLFARLEAEGFTDHRIPEIEPADIQIANREPPAGRARTRATLVRSLQTQFGRHQMSWDHIIDLVDETYAWLPDSAEAPLVWHALSPTLQTLNGPNAEREYLLKQVLRFNNEAIGLRKDGRLHEAEALMRQAIAVETVHRHPNHPKIAHRFNNLAVILMMGGKTEEALTVNAHAWKSKAGLHDLISARILTMRLALAMLTGMSCAQYLGQLKTLLLQPALPCLGDIDPIWDPSDVLRFLQSRLTPGQTLSICILARVLNHQRLVPALERWGGWARQPAVPLADSWPV